MATNAEIVAKILASTCPKCDSATLVATGFGGTLAFRNAWCVTLGFHPKLLASYVDCGLDETKEFGYLIFQCQKCGYEIRLDQSIGAWSGVTGHTAMSPSGEIVLQGA